MKTNQPMVVGLANFGTLHIWHKDGIGRVSDVLAIGNQYRASIGVSPILELTSYLRKPSTWRTIIAIHNKMVENANCALDSLEKLDIKETMENLPKIVNNKLKNANCLLDSLEKGEDYYKIDYAKILKSKQFKHIIKSQRGGKVENRGYWADLYLLIDIAMMMNEEFKVELIDTFVTKRLLIFRDEGGDAFKELNKLIDTLPDRIAKAKKRNQTLSQCNRRVYANMARWVNEKVNGEFNAGWNDDKKGAYQQTRRTKLLEQLCSFIKMGFVQDKDSLREALNRL